MYLIEPCANAHIFILPNRGSCIPLLEIEILHLIHDTLRYPDNKYRNQLILYTTHSWLYIKLCMMIPRTSRCRGVCIN